MRTARSKNRIFVADDCDEDGGLSRRENAKTRLENLRQKRKEKEREMAMAVPPAPPKRQWLRPPMPSSLPPPQEVDMSGLEFLFEKRLRHSDVKDRGRVVIPKEFALKHFPEIQTKYGIFMYMDDVTTPKLWTFRFGFWSNNSGRVHVLEHACEFFAMHGLINGDFIMFYIDRRVGRFAIGSRKADVQNSVRDEHHDLAGATLMDELLSASSTSDGVGQSAVEDESLAYFPMELLDDDFFDLPKL
ncbi:hypothetical protein F511_32110 [Dorcoceras hygrometricum]|uniref:TF-B3 domain-containing protein n=1 Tax=Dorcoceras hygrometricum TaxID=472368 RepID=A0A2Z7AFQ4_9LAMI|nr:hypothetical protein F511_32110 [Dorcoceras hygrometricum]